MLNIIEHVKCLCLEVPEHHNGGVVRTTRTMDIAKKFIASLSRKEKHGRVPGTATLDSTLDLNSANVTLL